MGGHDGQEPRRGQQQAPPVVVAVLLPQGVPRGVVLPVVSMNWNGGTYFSREDFNETNARQLQDFNETNARQLQDFNEQSARQLQDFHEQSARQMLDGWDLTEQNTRHMQDFSEPNARHMQDYSEQNARHMQDLVEQNARHMQDFTEQSARHMQDFTEQSARHMQDFTDQRSARHMQASVGNWETSPIDNVSPMSRWADIDADDTRSAVPYWASASQANDFLSVADNFGVCGSQQCHPMSAGSDEHPAFGGGDRTCLDVPIKQMKPVGAEKKKAHSELASSSTRNPGVWEQSGPSKAKQYLLLNQFGFIQNTQQQPQHHEGPASASSRDFCNGSSELPVGNSSRLGKAVDRPERGVPVERLRGKGQGHNQNWVPTRLPYNGPPEMCCQDTMKTQLQALQNENPDAVFITRRINKLGFNSAALLRSHFSAYGEVKAVYVAHSRVRSLITLGRRRLPQSRWHMRAAALGFVVMSQSEATATILSEGLEHDVNGVIVRVYPFTHRESHKAEAENAAEMSMAECEQLPTAESQEVRTTEGEEVVTHSCEGRSGGTGGCESPCAPYMTPMSPSSESITSGAEIAPGPYGNIPFNSFLANFSAEELHNAMPEIYED